MDVRQLRYFLGVLEAKSITKAADQLHVAQPALGLQIRKLEEELHVELFVRHSRGVTPTEAGLRLASHAEVVLRQFERAKQDLLDFSGKTQGRVGLGMTTTVSLVLAAAFAERCKREYPDVTLNMMEGLSERLMEWVYEDRLDITLTYNPDAIKGLVSEPLVREALYFVTSTKRGAPKNPTDIGLKHAVAEQLILPSRPHLLRVQVEAAAQNIGTELDVVFEVDSVATIKELLKADLGATILPYGAVRTGVRNGTFTARKIADPALYRTLSIAYSPVHPMSKSFLAVGNLLREVVRELAEGNTVGWEVWRESGKYN